MEPIDRETEKYKIKTLAIRGNGLSPENDEPLLYFTSGFISTHEAYFPKQGEIFSGKKLMEVLFAIILAFKDYCNIGDKNYIEALIAETRKVRGTRTLGDNTGRSRKTVCLINNAASMMGLTLIIKNEGYYTIIEVEEKLPPKKVRRNRSKKQKV